MNERFRLFPERASEIAGDVDRLAIFLTVTSVAITLILCVLVAYFAIRYRRRSEDEVPPLEKTSSRLEIISSIALFAVFMVMFFWGMRLYVVMKRPAENALEVNVIGKQWMWKLQHPGGQQEINELHIPLGRPVKLVMISHDVIHSFSIPAFRVKQDVVPGSYSTQWFTPTKKGEYDLFCQEYCGTGHPDMIGRVVVMDSQNYEAWLAGVPADDTPVISGARLFTTYGCLQCHGQTGPTLAGLYGRQVLLDDGRTVTADEAYLRESILNPSAKIAVGYGRQMPSFTGQLSEEQVGALVAYVKSLGNARSDSPSTQATGLAAPATRPTRDVLPRGVPNFPPSAEPPGVHLQRDPGDASP
jgi:cytochrome c oxidase subunit 2